MKMKLSPCMYCTQVPDPRACEDKGCPRWQAWFVEKWEDLRLQARLDREKAQLSPGGVCIGGNYYSQPHRVREYLAADPCEKCLCPKDVCLLPCKEKRAWLGHREEVIL